MKRSPVASVVRSGSLCTTIRRYADGRFGFDYDPAGAERVKVRLGALLDAEARASELMGAAKAGKVERLAIDEDEYIEFLRWRAERAGRKTVPALLDAFLRAKRGKGKSVHHLRQLEKDLGAFSSAFAGHIDLITRAQVEQWLDDRNVGPRRWNNLRESVVALCRFARREGALGANLAGAELVERKQTQVMVETYSPEELQKILGVVEEPWLPAIVLGAFAGMRPQELCPEPRSGKPGLTWGNILWRKNKIDVPAGVSKTRKRRFAPLTDAVAAFLGNSCHTPDDPVCPVGQLSKKTAEWGRLSEVGWRNDALRHSFASYRLAITLNLPALALEMGNSPAMIHRHYLDLKHEDEALKWFAIRPADTPANVVRMR